MSNYLRGCDVIGAETVRAYTDKDTVTKVQQFLRGIGGGKAFPIKVDGVLGPETNNAVKHFNTDFRNVPGDGELITDGTLSSMGITSSATPAEVIPKAAVLPSDGRPAKGWSQPQPEAMGPAITPDTPVPTEMPKWKIALLAVLGIAAAGATAAGIGLAVRGRHS